LNLVTTMDPFAGRYFSLDYIRRKVLRQSDAEIKEIDKQMEKEISTGKLPDPAAVDPMTGEPMDGAPMDAPPEEESEDITSTGPESVSPADYKRGEF